MVIGSGIRRSRVPWGPLTLTVDPLSVTVTPEGTVMGARPTRDIRPPLGWPGGTRPEGACGTRPEGASGTRPEGACGTRPEGACGTRPEDLPQNHKPSRLRFSESPPGSVRLPGVLRHQTWHSTS